jgi:hypothetical protein
VTYPAPELATAAQDVLLVLEKAGIPSCAIGGLVVSRWGEPRTTTDVDLSVLAPYGDEESTLDSLLAHFEARAQDAREFALTNRVLLIRTGDGVSVDVALAAFPFEVEAIQTATPWSIAPGIEIRTCSAEHLVVYKLVAARKRDLSDVEGIVLRQRRKLDAGRIRRWGRLLAELKEDPDLLRPFEDIWRQIR